mmetsp:Transcript_29658/g.70481  ORF Transcript_29658/g.70481 Transcript_29658/m.70481 type:complete len:743 (-) Transcript_29658:136-2364(-)
MDMEALAGSVGSPAVFVGLGVTTLALVGATVFLSRSSSDSSRGGAGAAAERQVEELDRSKYPGGHLTIYYGSQTGTAQMFANQIASESESRGFKARVVDLQDVVDNEDGDAIDAARIRPQIGPSPAEDGVAGELDEVDGDGALIRASLADPCYRDPDAGRSTSLFFVATYGEGEPTDNAQQFVELMKVKSGIDNIYKISPSEEAPGDGGEDGGPADPSARDATFLSDLDYAVFGLGNKQYEHYNNMSRFVDASLGRCGADRIADLGLGDDDDDLEGDFESWKDNVFWPAMAERYVKGAEIGGGRDGEEDGATALLPCPYRVEYLKDANGSRGSPSPDLVQTSSRHYLQAVDCPIAARRELRDPSDPGSTLHVEIDVSDCMETNSYVTADNLGILPRNDPKVVEAVASALGYDLDAWFDLVPVDEAKARHSLPFPTPCTVRDCLERYCDLSGPPRRSDLKQLANYARGDIDKKALLRMSSKEGKAEYKEKIVGMHVGIADIVTRLCPSFSCPLEHFVMTCPRLLPRYYTISSSSSVHPTRIHVTLAVLEEEKKDGGKFTGVCSGHLASSKVGDTVRAFVRESTFRLPRRTERPIVMLGPGTGIAPMRALLQERRHGRSNGVDHGKSVLYFGCKDRSMDYIYRDELEAFVEDGTLDGLHLAFSREQDEKVYVQHLLKERAKETWDLIDAEKASVYVCGAVRMGADVDRTLQDIVSSQGNMSAAEARAYLEDMSSSGRFVQELWS